jgi:hypothetical protein
MLTLKRHFTRPPSARGYNTFLERQTNFAPLNMDTTAIINLLEGLTLSHLSLTQVLLATQVGLKVVHVGIEFIMRVGQMVDGWYSDGSWTI